MKFFSPIICLTILALLASCDNLEKYFPKTTFDNPFPKNNRNLTKILGDNLTIKSGADTLSLKISASKNYNLITDAKTGDTLFKGTVCKFRGLFYFSQQLNDTSYWIYAVKLSNNLVYGLNSALTQTLLIDRAINTDQQNKMVKYFSADKIRLHPDKRSLKNLFSSIIDSIYPDTIVNFQKFFPFQSDTTKIVEQIDAEEFEIISKIYPNPTTDFVNIELQQKNNFNYSLTDLTGKTVIQGQLAESKNKIDLSKLTPGVFYLNIANPTGNLRETTKLVKSE